MILSGNPGGIPQRDTRKGPPSPFPMLPTKSIVIDFASHLGQAINTGFAPSSSYYYPCQVPFLFDGEWSITGVSVGVSVQGAAGDGLLVGFYVANHATKSLDLISEVVKIPIEASGTGYKAVTGFRVTPKAGDEIFALSTLPTGDTGVYRCYRSDGGQGIAINYMRWGGATLTGGLASTGGGYAAILNSSTPGSLPSKARCESADVVWDWVQTIPLRFQLERQ